MVILQTCLFQTEEFFPSMTQSVHSTVDFLLRAEISDRNRVSLQIRGGQPYNVVES